MKVEELRDFIKNNLSVILDTHTRSEYVGDLKDGESLYKDYSTITLSLELEGETISTSTIYLG